MNTFLYIQFVIFGLFLFICRSCNTAAVVTPVLGIRQPWGESSALESVVHNTAHFLWNHPEGTILRGWCGILLTQYIPEQWVEWLLESLAKYEVWYCVVSVHLRLVFTEGNYRPSLFTGLLQVWYWLWQESTLTADFLVFNVKEKSCSSVYRNFLTFIVTISYSWNT